jgi:RNA recognition motif-containing protein
MVTDVYNTGKGYAFVTFDREEDSKMAIQVNNTVDTTAVRVSEHDYLAIFFFDAKVGKQILLSRQIPNQKILGSFRCRGNS